MPKLTKEYKKQLMLTNEQYVCSLKYLITDKLIEKDENIAIREEVESSMSWTQSHPDADIDKFKEKKSKSKNQC